MIRNSFLLLVCVLGMVSTSRAQNYEWMMEIRVLYSHSGCPSEKIDIINAVFNGTNWGLNSDVTGPIGNEHIAYARGTNWEGIADKKISIAVKGTCSDVFITPHDLSIFGTYCSSTSFQGPGTNPPGKATVTIRFFPLFQPVKLATSSCNEVTFTASSCSYTGSYVWELSTNGSTYTPIARTLSTVTFNATELINLGYSNPYALFYLRLKDATLPDRNITNKIFTFKVYAPPPTVSISGFTDVVCNGQTNGTVTLQISNSTAAVNRFFINYTNLDNNVTGLVPDTGTGNTIVSGLGVGRWAFQVVNNSDKDTYGVCSYTVNQRIDQPTPVAVSFNVPLHNGVAIKCNGGNDGEATAIGSGGVGGYKDFLWSTSATTATITGRTAGTYTVSLKDANNCPASGSVELKEPAPVQVLLSPSTGYNGYAVSCWNKSDGGVNSAVSGGITGQPYTYLWSTGATTSTISGRGTGTYSVTVKDVNGCADLETITLGAPLPIDFTIDQTGTLACPGDETISLEGISVINTIGTVSYAWSSGETVASITGKGAGAYTLTVSDQQGCSTAKSVALDNPRAHSVGLVPLSNYNGSRISCNGRDDGELRAIVKDPDGVEVSAQNYLWTANGVKIGEGSTLTSFNGLREAAYKVVITYGAACETEGTYTLSDPDPVIVNAVPTTDYNGQPIKCFNGTDANIRATAGGGTPGVYSYRWNTGATTALLTGIGAGTYVVTVKDVNQCEGNATVTLENPAPVEASILSVSDYSGYGVSCYGSSDGIITSEASGGSGGYTYNWSDGKTTPLVTGMAAGSYTLTVSDNNGCSDATTQSISSPAVVTLSVVREKNISCFTGSDGEIELLAGGGVGNYEYSRSNGASWQPENVFSMLTAGAYTITLRDGNGCTETAPSTLTQPTQINIAIADKQPAFCNDPAGTARAVVTGGVGGYTYRWEDSDEVVVDTDDVLSGVKGGVYTVIVRDNNACERRSDDVSITSTDGAQSTYVATAARCFDSSDGSAEITITKGDGPFVIEWPDGQSTLQGVNLKKAEYNVVITDRNNCTVVQTVDVPAPDAIALVAQNSVIPTCNGLCDGQMTLAASGGVGGYVYEWNGKTGAAQTQLCALTYHVTVTDANNCVLHQDVELLQPEPLDIRVAQSTLATCKDGCDGSLEALATGGNGGYQYTWAAGGNTNIKTGLCPGTYLIAVQDMKGCQAEASLVLNNTPALPLDLGGGVTLCVGQSHTLDAGASWTSVKWGSSTGFESTGQRVTIADVGSYWVEVLSDKGCVGQDTFLLETSYDLLQASFMIPQEAIAGDTVVMIDISWPLPETVQWEYPAAMREVLNLGDVLFGQFDEAGTYEVAMTARLGECVDQISKTIVILDEGAGGEGGKLGYEKFVKEFTVYPNPTDGAFDVGIELLEESHVTLSIWNSPTGILIKQVQRDHQKLYHVSFDLRPLNAGTYILRLDHAKGKEYIRFVVY
ncbi:T9SS type A sorting domain-containing protein [Parachryseolinea silvisoli]|uniref:T9SS type A sorting domain-containing protein n=1 Tax=Parachryseolinea silvisoli TaxID=2873601 RepID=UPI002265F52E|nr:T9SS type A sorting domain-containing protein [Parachryseolinea silvisoli]MCD9017605.1 T9SS type A sorting domain-containing protein [Parachryseolinea silvisoli]